MSANPDIWMPLYIGDYLAATSHLGALESGAYLHLLMHQWKNKKLPPVGDSLRRIAKVDIDAWSNAWALLEDFFDCSKGYPIQLRLEEIRAEWLNRKEKAREKASLAAKSRWDRASSNASSITQALLERCPSPSPSSIKKNSIADARFGFFKDAFFEYFEKNSGVGKPPWDAKEATRLKAFLKSKPDCTIEHWKRILSNREASVVTHGESLSRWIGNASIFYKSPLNEFGKPIMQNQFHVEEKEGRESDFDRLKRQQAEALRKIELENSNAIH